MLMHLFVQYVLPVILTGLGGLLALGMKWGVAWVKTRAQTSTAFRLIAEVASSAEAVVLHVEAELKPKMLSALADGQLTAEEGAALKTEAMRLLKESIQAKGAGFMGQLVRFVGGNLDVWLSGQVEGALLRMQTAAAPQIAPVIAGPVLSAAAVATPVLARP